MKKILALTIVLSIVVCSVLTGCSEDKSPVTESSNKDPMVVSAITTLEQYWKDIYAKGDIGDGYFEIKNTRVINMKENNTELFKDVKCVVEFDLYTDFHGSAPYYKNMYQYNNVVVYKSDKPMEVVSKIIDYHCSAKYNYDVSGFVESVVDCNDEYNCVKNLKKQSADS